MASFEGGSAPAGNYKEGLTAPPKDTRVQTEVSGTVEGLRAEDRFR